MNENVTNEGTCSFLNNEDNSFNLQLSFRLSFKSFSTVFELFLNPQLCDWEVKPKGHVDPWYVPQVAKLMRS